MSLLANEEKKRFEKLTDSKIRRTPYEDAVASIELGKLVDTLISRSKKRNLGKKELIKTYSSNQQGIKFYFNISAKDIKII